MQFAIRASINDKPIQLGSATSKKAEPRIYQKQVDRIYYDGSTTHYIETTLIKHIQHSQGIAKGEADEGKIIHLGVQNHKGWPLYSILAVVKKDVRFNHTFRECRLEGMHLEFIGSSQDISDPIDYPDEWKCLRAKSHTLNLLLHLKDRVDFVFEPTEGWLIVYSKEAKRCKIHRSTDAKRYQIDLQNQLNDGKYSDQELQRLFRLGQVEDVKISKQQISKEIPTALVAKWKKDGYEVVCTK